MLGQSVAQVQNAMGSINAYVDNHDGKVVTSRQPASGYLTLNSRDRYVNASPTQQAPNVQPWNNFVLQKAEAIIPTYARRLAITEVRLPWYIPNITLRNNRISLVLNNGGTAVELPNIPVSNIPVFFTPTEIATQLNFNMNAVAVLAGLPGGSAPTIQWQPLEGLFNIVSGTLPYSFRPPPGTTYQVSPGVNAVSTNYYTLPSLAQTLGVPISFISPNTVPVYRPTSTVEALNTTTCLYTDYIDIVSDKLMRFTDARDGGSANKTKTSVVMRLYLADEASLQNVDGSGNPIIVGTAPFLIHRQFATPKQVQWDSKSMVGDLDIQVFDMFGDLVYVGPSSYPDFQITVLVSEN